MLRESLQEDEDSLNKENRAKELDDRKTRLSGYVQGSYGVKDKEPDSGWVLQSMRKSSATLYSSLERKLVENLLGFLRGAKQDS